MDSGSIGTFVGEALAAQLHIPTQWCEVTQFIAADGSPMSCSQRFPKLQWGAQGHMFMTDVGVLPLQCFDMILGHDWLEECSPMWVHWKNKVMKFTYQGKRITLYGVHPETARCASISTRKLKGMIRRGVVSYCVEMSVLPISVESLHESGV